MSYQDPRDDWEFLHGCAIGAIIVFIIYQFLFNLG